MKQLTQPAIPVALLVTAMWAIEVVNWLSGHQLASLGIVPRTAQGLMGVPLAPFLHGSLAHMASNTLPMLILGVLVALSGTGRLFGASAIIVVVGGLGVWILGRNAIHVGASILIFGYFGYLVALSFYERSIRSLVLALFTLVLYSGLIWGVLPQERAISWEGHLFGFLGGIVAARLMRRTRRRSR